MSTLKAFGSAIVAMLATLPFAMGQAAPAAGDCPALQVALADAPAAVDPRPQPAARPSDVPDRQACLLSVEDYLRGRAGFVPVDVRKTAFSGRVRIPGMLAMATEEIGKKPFLRGASVVLVGAGLDEAELSEQCSRLRQEGMSSVRVLSGGVRALARQGERLDGQAEDLAALAWVSAAELHRALLAAPAGVLSWDVPGEALPEALRGLRRIAGEAGMAQGAEQLKSLGERNPLVPLAVVTADRQAALALVAALEKAKAANVFVLRGGLPAYVDYLDQQRRIAAGANMRLVRPCGAG